MEPRLSLITLGVADLAASTRFYEALGWARAMKEARGVAFFQLGPMALSLYPMADLCRDAAQPQGTRPAFGGITLAHNVRERDQVDAAVALWTAAGGTVARAPYATDWGGYIAYVADPDGHLWEIAWNPGFPIDDAGGMTVPE